VPRGVVVVVVPTVVVDVVEVLPVAATTRQRKPRADVCVQRRVPDAVLRSRPIDLHTAPGWGAAWAIDTQTPLVAITNAIATIERRRANTA